MKRNSRPFTNGIAPGLRRRRRGLGYVEVLIASAISALSLAVMVHLWSFSMTMSTQASDRAAGFNLVRQSLENIVETGFTKTPEAPASSPTVHYYDINLNIVDNSPARARYKVSTSVVSNSLVAGSNPATPTDTALRLVSISVVNQLTGATVTQASTYLTKGGL